MNRHHANYETFSLRAKSPNSFQISQKDSSGSLLIRYFKDVYWKVESIGASEENRCLWDTLTQCYAEIKQKAWRMKEILLLLTQSPGSLVALMLQALWECSRHLFLSFCQFQKGKTKSDYQPDLISPVIKPRLLVPCPLLNASQGGDATTSLGNLFQCLTILCEENLSNIQPNLSWYNLKPFPCFLLLVT